MSTSMGNEPDKTTTRNSAPTSDRTVRTDVTKTRAATASEMPTQTDRSKQARKDVVAEQKEQFGGIKWGSAFFGWLTATGTAVLLIALLGAIGTVAGMPTNNKAADKLVDQASANADKIGLAGAIALLVILFVSYFAGGYVAGRMARFNGLKQGVAVWLWALIVAVLVAVLGLVAGDKFNVTDQLNNFPKIPVSKDDLTSGGLIALAVIAVTSLVGAVLGGLSGMRFHRKVDKAGYAG